MVTVRPLTRDERRHLASAQLNALEHTPYFAHAIFKLHPVAAEGLGTFGVDAHWRLYMDPDCLTREWSPQEAGAVLAHEVSHLLRDHHDRGAAFGAGIDHDAWALATDAAINEYLVACGLPLPEGVITPANQGLPANGIEEEYYQALRSAQPPSSPEDGDGEPQAGCGTGAGDAPAGYELPAADQEAPGLTPAEATIVRRRVAEAVQEAASRASHGRGTIPASLTRWAEDTLAPPKVDWRKELRSEVRRAVTWAHGGASDYTYNRPGRRRIPRVLTPAMHSPQVTVGVVIDTSGSMGADQLQDALAEVAGITRHSRSRLTVATVDAQAHVQHRIRRPEQIVLTGGGGTDMRVGIRAMQTLPKHQRPDVIVVLTDGFTPWPSTPTRERLIIALVGAGAPETPAWASTIRLDG